jgi:hypothetical protein
MLKKINYEQNASFRLSKNLKDFPEQFNSSLI